MHVIAGKYYKQKLQVPKGGATRPTSSRLREAVFNILQEEIEGAVFLDIFAGSGAVGIEALSRGAKSATFIEQDRNAFLALNNNLQSLKITSGIPLFGDFEKNLKVLGKRGALFDVIFADAPYKLEATEALMGLIFENKLLKPSGVLFIENAADLSEGMDLKGFVLVNSRKGGKTYLHQLRT